MGGEISTGVSRNEKRENIRDRNIQVKDVETFFMSVYSCCSRIEAMWNILGSQHGQKAFRDFLESEMSEELIDLYSECARLKEVEKPTMYVLRKYVDTVLKDYVDEGAERRIIINATLAKDLRAIQTDTIENYHDPVGYMFELLGRVENEVVCLMARDQFNRFLLSRFYKNWRANERGRAVAITSTDAKVQVKNYSARISARELSGRVSNKSFRSVVPEDMSVRALSTISGKERDHILESQSWLSSLVVGAEILPIGLTLAKVSKIRRGFPLVYVNKHFEKMTGFSRNGVIGRNCKDFLQCAETEKECIGLLSDALKARHCVTTVITNVTKTGIIFRNLLSLKPVFDNEGTFVYVIGLHSEMGADSNEDDEMSKILIMDRLLKILPNKIIDEVNERKPNGCWEALRFKWNSVAPAPVRRNSSSKSSKSGKSGKGSDANGESDKENSDRLRQKAEAASAKLRARALSVEESNKKLAAQAAAAAQMRQNYSSRVSSSRTSSSSAAASAAPAAVAASRAQSHSNNNTTSSNNNKDQEFCSTVNNNDRAQELRIGGASIGGKTHGSDTTTAAQSVGEESFGIMADSNMNNETSSRSGTDSGDSFGSSSEKTDSLVRLPEDTSDNAAEGSSQRVMEKQVTVGTADNDAATDT